MDDYNTNIDSLEAFFNEALDQLVEYGTKYPRSCETAFKLAVESEDALFNLLEKSISQAPSDEDLKNMTPIEIERELIQGMTQFAAQFRFLAPMMPLNETIKETMTQDYGETSLEEISSYSTDDEAVPAISMLPAITLMTRHCN